MDLKDHQNPDGTYNGVTALAELTGRLPSEMREIAEQVMANHAKLRACAYHEFERIARPDDSPDVQARLGDKWRCTNCGGEIDSVAHSWHEQGRRPKPQE